MTADAKVTTVLVIALLVLPVWFFWDNAKLAYSRSFGDGVEYYSYAYQVLPENVHLQTEPHDCETDVPPLGKKYCHYEKVVEFQGKDQDTTSDPQWYAKRYVFVTWSKVQD